MEKFLRYHFVGIFKIAQKTLGLMRRGSQSTNFNFNPLDNDPFTWNVSEGNNSDFYSQTIHLDIEYL